MQPERRLHLFSLQHQATTLQRTRLKPVTCEKLKTQRNKKQATFSCFFQAKLAFRHSCEFFCERAKTNKSVFLRAALSHPNVKVFLIKLGFPPQGHQHRAPPTTWQTIFAKLRCHPAWLEYCAAPLENVTHEQSLTLSVHAKARPKQNWNCKSSL